MKKVFFWIMFVPCSLMLILCGLIQAAARATVASVEVFEVCLDIFEGWAFDDSYIKNRQLKGRTLKQIWLSIYNRW